MRSLTPTSAVWTVFLIGLTSLLTAQSEPPPITAGFYDSIHSKHLSRTRSLQVFLPDSYEISGRSYPVLLHLYGDRINQYWLEAVSTVHGLTSSGFMPEVILIGIDEVDRYRYLIPRDGEGLPTEIDRFTAFLEKELIPYIDRTYRTEDYRILVGPQVGANFGLYTLLNSPHLFDAFILTHPFRWANGREYLEQRSEEVLTRWKDRKAFLYITSNDDDEYERSGHPYLERLSERAIQAAPKGLRVVRNHLGSTGEFYSPTGLRAGLKSLFDGFDLPNDPGVGSLRDLTEYYAAYSARLGLPVDPPELELVQQSDRLKEVSPVRAIEILNYTKELYPEGAMAYCRLGFLYETQGEFEQSIENLTICVAKVPNYQRAKDTLEGLVTEDSDESSS